MIKYGAAYDQDGEFVGVYQCPEMPDLHAQTPDGGRIYPIPAACAAALPLLVDPLKPEIAAMIKAAKLIAQNAGCSTAYGRIDTDPASQLQIVAAGQAAIVDKSKFSRVWTLEDGTQTPPLNSAAMLSICAAISAHFNDCHEHAAGLLSALAAAETVPAAYAVLEDAQWPGSKFNP